MATTFTLFLGLSDMGMSTTATNISCTAGQYTQIGSSKTNPQTINYWGQGVIANGVDSRETAKITLQSVASGALTGQIRLAVTDANGVNLIPVYQNNLSNFTTGVKLGLSAPGAKENSYIVCLFNPDSTTTVNFASTTNVFNVPITRVFL